MKLYDQGLRRRHQSRCRAHDCIPHWVALHDPRLLCGNHEHYMLLNDYYSFARYQTAYIRTTMIHICHIADDSGFSIRTSLLMNHFRNVMSLLSSLYSILVIISVIGQCCHLAAKNSFYRSTRKERRQSNHGCIQAHSLLSNSTSTDTGCGRSCWNLNTLDLHILSWL